MPAQGPIDISILATPEAEPGVVLGAFDALWSVGVLWNRVNGLAEVPVFAPNIVAATSGPLTMASGATIHANRAVADPVRTDIIFLPSILTDFGEGFGARNAVLIDWLRDAHAQGVQIVSSCTGSFLLAAAGLLDGREATTHWAFVETMRAAYPEIRVRGDRILVSAGEDTGIVTAGGATSWTDMILYLTGRFAGEEEARRLARLYLFDWHHDGQNPYSRLMTRPQEQDAAIRAAQEWLADNYMRADIVTEMTDRSGLNARTFARRFRAATGYAPLEYVQMIRIEEARQLLETTSMAVDDIAADVGYQDTPSFARLFRRLVGDTPAAYRRRTHRPAYISHLPKDPF